jgi:hypothetical protein
LLAVAACAPAAVSIDSPQVPAATRTVCRDLVDALPDKLAGQERRDVEPVDALGAAWGDPAIELRCGVGTPEGLTRFSECQEVNGVGWYVPDDQVADNSADLTLTTIGFEPAVEVRIPGSLRPPNDALVELAAPIKNYLEQVKHCV